MCACILHFKLKMFVSKSAWQVSFYTYLRLMYTKLLLNLFFNIKKYIKQVFHSASIYKETLR